MPARTVSLTPSRRTLAAETTSPGAAAPSTPAPEKPQDAFERLTERAVELALEEASRERTVVSLGESAAVAGATLSASGKLTEQVALDKGNRLVAGDSRRKAGAENGQVWTKLGVKLEGGVGFGMTIANGVGASFGLAAGAELQAIVAADKRLTVSNVAGTLAEQGQLALVALDPLRLLAADHAPGTELMVRGHASASAGITGGAMSATRFASVNAGATVALARGAEYTKNVKVLGDGKVYVQVSRVSSTGGSISAGVEARPELPGSGLVGSAAKRVEKELKLTAAVGVSGSLTGSLRVGAVFDLNTPEGRAGYAELMNANPLTLEVDPQAARELLERIGQGAAYSERSRSGSGTAEARFGRNNLLSFSSTRRSADGVLMQAGEGEEVVTTQLAEREYVRNVSGILPRLLMGEERSVSMRLGSVAGADGVEDRAALMQLNLSHPEVTQAEQAAFGRFAAVFGAELPTATREDKKGKLSVQLGMTDSQLAALDTKSPSELEAAFASAMATLQGVLPPWQNEAMGRKSPNYHFPPAVRTVKAEFFDSLREWQNINSNKPSEEQSIRDRIARDYRGATGRDLRDDLASYEAMHTFAREVTDSRGKGVAGWGSTLSKLGRLGSEDLRSVLVALHQQTGASLVSLDISANGAKLQAGEGGAPLSIAELVGTVLTPAEVR